MGTVMLGKLGTTPELSTPPLVLDGNQIKTPGKQCARLTHHGRGTRHGCSYITILLEILSGVLLYHLGSLPETQTLQDPRVQYLQIAWIEEVSVDCECDIQFRLFCILQLSCTVAPLYQT